MVKLVEFSSTEKLNEQLAAQIVNQLKLGLEQNGKASLVVSGGKTPLDLFKLLSRQKLDWQNVYITLADERWVDVNDKASNERAVRQNLLQNEAIKAHFISLKNQHSTPFAGTTETEQALKAMPVPFDVVILGMGDDGHTASLFPGAANLQSALDLNSNQLCIGITPLKAPYDRVTLTLPAILNSHHIYLHIIGDDKKKVYQQAVAGKDVNQMPVRAILTQSKVPVEVFWSA